MIDTLLVGTTSDTWIIVSDVVVRQPDTLSAIVVSRGWSPSWETVLAVVAAIGALLSWWQATRSADAAHQANEFTLESRRQAKRSADAAHQANELTLESLTLSFGVSLRVQISQWMLAYRTVSRRRSIFGSHTGI